jgi:hypothetical protein
MDEINLPDAIEPTEWYVIFHRKVAVRWLSWLACGEFKHVSAMAYCPGFKAWLVYDTQLRGTRIFLVAHGRDGETIKPFFMAHTRDCAVVKIARSDVSMGLSSRLGLYCVPAIKHLLGVRCAAVRPDAFYRHILRNGGTLIDERRHADASDRPQLGAGTAASAE